MIQRNLDTVTKLKDAVLQHPMCLRFKEDGSQYMVIFPEGDFPVDGVHVSKFMGCAKALDILLFKMESYWLGSYPNPRTVKGTP